MHKSFYHGSGGARLLHGFSSKGGHIFLKSGLFQRAPKFVCLTTHHAGASKHISPKNAQGAAGSVI